MPKSGGVGVGDWSGADTNVVVNVTSTMHSVSYGVFQPGSGQEWSDVRLYSTTTATKKV
jgi:hypothetical protein